MTAFDYRHGELHAEGVALSAIAAEYDTPCFVYSRQAIEQAYQAWDSALQGVPHLVCFAVKANSNLAVLNLLARQGAGFDIVSGGELERVLAAGGEPSRIVFSGLGKTAAEMRRALEVGIHCFNIESTVELERLQLVAAELNIKAPISLRVNPDVDAKTHPYISTGLKENKFGIDIAHAPAVYRRAAELSHIDICGVDCHIGSQLTDDTPLIDALKRLLELVDGLAEEGIHIHHLDLGGGLNEQVGNDANGSSAALNAYSCLREDHIDAAAECARLGENVLQLDDSRLVAVGLLDEQVRDDWVGRCPRELRRVVEDSSALKAR